MLVLAVGGGGGFDQTHSESPPPNQLLLAPAIALRLSAPGMHEKGVVGETCGRIDRSINRNRLAGLDAARLRWTPSAIDPGDMGRPALGLGRASPHRHNTNETTD